VVGSKTSIIYLIMTNSPQIIGRFAPAPTGALHIGSLVSALGSRLMAKSRGGRWLLRLDDLDTPRQKPGMADDIMATLEEFALCWDGEVSRQSSNLDHYSTAFGKLLEQGVLYPCCCSRKDIAQAASAPHPEDDVLPYSGSCRNGIEERAVVRSWRVRVTEQRICFNDLRLGKICRNLAKCGGDFVVRRGDGEFAYQLAVVVDDFITGVTQVVRGDDLLPSTARQIYLQQLLKMPQPVYCHLPLVTGPEGKKLSKRDNLVSYGLGNWKGREGELLFDALRFLGQNPPASLAGAGCREIMEWGEINFDPALIPLHGGVLYTQST
jgi:glutamyl-Q tRNA(Asp) synthetase